LLREREIVCEEDQRTAIGHRFELDAAQLVRIVLEGLVARERNGLVAYDTVGSIHGAE